MRVIVTGGAGFIGSHLVDRLQADGWDVVVVDRATGPSIQLYSGPTSADAIFHLASPVGPIGVLWWASLLVEEVVQCAAIVRSWARLNGCPLVYVSTSEVYGSGHGDAEDQPCIFRPATSARKEYAVAKLAAETMLRNTAGLDVRIVRPFNVAGPRQDPALGFVVPRFVAQALAGEPLTVYQPGTQVRAFAHVSDIVSGLLATLERGRSGEVYNLGNPDNACTIRQLAEEVIEETGSASSIVVVDPTTLHGPAFREAPDKIPIIDKAVRELGWEPRIGRRDTIRDVIASRTAVAA